MFYNVSRPREVVKPANWVVSAKIELIRENEAEARKNQQFLVTAVTCWRSLALKKARIFFIFYILKTF